MIRKRNVKKDPKMLKLIETELLIMTKVTHPNIVHVYEVMEDKKSAKPDNAR